MLARKVQGKAGGSGTVRTPSLCTGPAKAPAEQTALSIWPLLRQEMLPFMALAVRDEAGRVGISHAGESHQGKSGFQSIYRIFSTGYHAGRIGNALYSATETSI